MNAPWITILLGVLSAAAIVAAIAAFHRAERPQTVFTLVAALGSAALLVVVWFAGRGEHPPLANHLEGLLLLAAALGGAILYLQSHSRLPGVAIFGLPVLALVLLWAICASSFTFTPFAPGSVARLLHRWSVYLGAIFFALAAAAGGLYLLVRRRLQHLSAPTSSMASAGDRRALPDEFDRAAGGASNHESREDSSRDSSREGPENTASDEKGEPGLTPSRGGPRTRGRSASTGAIPPRGRRELASLEAAETFIVRAATVGFALLTIGMITGGVLIWARRPAPPAGWWYSPKVLLALGAYLLYALVMNVRFTTVFRGTRAAWMAIGGLLLLIVTFALVTALPASGGL